VLAEETLFAGEPLGVQVLVVVHDWHLLCFLASTLAAGTAASLRRGASSRVGEHDLLAAEI
jgi:hypothetical protein